MVAYVSVIEGEMVIALEPPQGVQADPRAHTWCFEGHWRRFGAWRNRDRFETGIVIVALLSFFISPDQGAAYVKSTNELIQTAMRFRNLRFSTML